MKVSDGSLASVLPFVKAAWLGSGAMANLIQFSSRQSSLPLERTTRARLVPGLAVPRGRRNICKMGPRVKHVPNVLLAFIMLMKCSLKFSLGIFTGRAVVGRRRRRHHHPWLQVAQWPVGDIWPRMAQDLMGPRPNEVPRARNRNQPTMA